VESKWFETVAIAQSRAKRRLPRSVYDALIGGSEKGVTLRDNVEAFDEVGFFPRIADLSSQRSLETTLMGQSVSMPVLISPTGVQAVHPDGEVAVARAAASRGVAMGLSCFASRPLEEVTAVHDYVFFQMYWIGDRARMAQRLERARSAGAKGIILTLDWSFSVGRDWGSPWIPDRIDANAVRRLAPQIARRPKWLWSYVKTGKLPNLTTPNMVIPPEASPTFFGAYYEWMQSPLPSWADVQWLIEQWSGPFMIKGVSRVDDAKRAVDVGATSISVSNHGGNNLDGTPGTIRSLTAIADAVGDDLEVLMDGGVRRGSDVAKALALGANGVLIGRAYLWGLACNGQAGVENVLDLIRSGLESALLGLGKSSVHDLDRGDVRTSPDFFRGQPTDS
jgi:pre-mycofactocin synthase